jgi:hypothetical protein
MYKIVTIVIGISLVLFGGGLTLLVVKGEQKGSGKQNPHERFPEVSGTQNPHIYSERLPTDKEMQDLLQGFRRNIAVLPTDPDRRTVEVKSQLTSFQQAWAEVNPTIAPFLGQRGRTTWMDYVSIYPSRTQGTVCIIQASEVGEQTVRIDLAIGTVVNGSVQTTAQQVLVLEQNTLGVASIKESRPIITEFADPPLPLPVAASDLPESTRMLELERFNQANCTADLPETASMVTPSPRSLQSPDHRVIDAETR